jgi:hypothetical protein
VLAPVPLWELHYMPRSLLTEDDPEGPGFFFLSPIYLITLVALSTADFRLFLDGFRFLESVSFFVFVAPINRSIFLRGRPVRYEVVGRLVERP